MLMLSSNGEQKLFPEQNGNITLNKANNLTHFHLPLPEHERTKVPTFHRYWAEQNRTQFRPDPNHQDPNSIDLLNISTSTQPLQIPLFSINTPPPAVARPTGIISSPPSPWLRGHQLVHCLEQLFKTSCNFQ